MDKNLKNSVLCSLNAITFNVIRRRYSLQEVPRRRIHNAFATAMSICVAVGNKVMDTPELPLPIKRHEAPKYDVESSVQCGQSMIEMLGVLAIIAVLSVGGIASYSKAMMKWKTNKATEEYSTIIFGMLEHIDDVRKMSPQSGYTGLADLAIALNLIPNNWHKVGDKHFNDTYGNMIQVQARAQNLVFDIFIGYTKDSQVNSGWSPQLCESLISNLAQPLHAAINIVNTYQSGKGGIYYRGDAYCGGGIPCVSNMTLSNIHDMCKYCDDSNKWCCITLEF